MGIIFAFFGYGESRSVAFSFREFYSKAITRAERLTRLPSDIVAFAPLVEATLAAYRLAFASLAEYHALMIVQPFHLATRRSFLDNVFGGNASDALADVDARIVELRKNVDLAEEGRAPHQQPGLQPIALSTLQAGSQLGSALSLSTGGSLLTAHPPASVISAGPSASLLGVAPLSLAGRPIPQSLFPDGVFANWGDNAVRYGVAKTDFGLAFGNNGVAFTGASVTMKPGCCIASCAPGKFSKGRSTWCVTPTVCSTLGYDAHARPLGTTDEQFEVRPLPKGTDSSGWTWIVPVGYAELRKSIAPSGPWRIALGPTGRYDWKADGHHYPPEEKAGGKGSGSKGKGSKGKKRDSDGKSKPANFDRLLAGMSVCRPAALGSSPPLPKSLPHLLRTALLLVWRMPEVRPFSLGAGSGTRASTNALGICRA